MDEHAIELRRRVVGQELDANPAEVGERISDNAEVAVEWRGLHLKVHEDANRTEATAEQSIATNLDMTAWVIDFDNLAGTFTYKDGRKRALTNGIGGNAGQQWRPYPSVFAPDIFSEDIPVIPTLD
jgi:hypothetical protein